MRTVYTSIITLALSILLFACGGSGGGGGASVSDQGARIEIAGAGIKGPLAFADTRIYKLDPAFPQFYDPNNPISTAITNDAAQISGLSVPRDIAPPYILTIGGALAVDLNTNKPPVISTLVTVITENMLAQNRPIYMTPLTTLAFHMAIYGTGASASAADFVQAMENAATQASIAFAVSDAISIDIFSSPLVIDDNTDTLSEQEEAVHHRAALEAFAAKVHTLSVSLGNVSSDEVIKRLAQDLQSDGVIDNTADGATVGGIDPSIMLQDPMDLVIPNTQYSVAEVTTLMDEERVLIGTDRGPTFYKDSIAFATTPATPTSDGNSAGSNSPATTTGELVSTLFALNLPSSGKIVISGEHDVVISGLHITNSNGTCIEVKNGSSNIIIENSVIGPCGNLGIDITSNSNHITIRNNYIHDIQHEAVKSYNSRDIAIDSNVIENVESGYEMEATSGGNVNLSFTNNYVKNVSRRSGSDNGGNVAMAAWVSGGGIRINNNIAVNILGESNPEDLVNLYITSGTASDPIQINDNKFIGGGPSDSGGGILVGDFGGSHAVVKNNILVNPGQYGIGVSGGSDFLIQNNQVYSRQFSFTNVGIYVWGQYGQNCGDVTVQGNDVNYTKYNGALSSNWDGGNCGNISGWSDNDWNAPIGEDIADIYLF